MITELTDEQYDAKITECLNKLQPIVAEICGDYTIAGEVLTLLLGSLASAIDMPQEALLRAVNISRAHFDKLITEIKNERASLSIH